MKKRFVAALLASVMCLSGCMVKNDTNEMMEELYEKESQDKDSAKSGSSDAEESADEPSEDVDDGIVVGYEEGNMPHFKISKKQDSYYAYPDWQMTKAGEYSLQSVMLMEDDREKYPELDKVLCAKTDENVERFNSECEKFISDAKAASDGADSQEDIDCLYVIDDVCLTRGNDRYLSYYEDICYNWDEFRPEEKIGFAFDVVTGKEVELSKVLTISEDELNEILGKKLSEAYPDQADEISSITDSISGYKYDEEDSYNWYFAVDGIHFIFNEYTSDKVEAAVIKEAIITYDEGYVADKYVFDTGRGYIFMRDDLYLYNDAMYSTGSSELCLYYKDSIDEGFGDSISLALGDQYVTVEEYFDIELGFEAYDVMTPEGREFLYVDTLDYGEIIDSCIFEITGGSLKAVGTFHHHPNQDGDNKDYWGEPAMTDPNEMIIGQERNVFGCLLTYGTYKVGEDGIPELIGDYRIDSLPDGASALEDIEADIVDEDGNVTGQTTVKEGTVVYPYRTDADTYVDCKLEDGSLIRFTITFEDWSVWIGDKTVDELFDGLLYWG